jgi:hypothetical protein
VKQICHHSETVFQERKFEVRVFVVLLFLREREGEIKKKKKHFGVVGISDCDSLTQRYIHLLYIHL